MNQVIKTLTSHRSIRKFSINPVSDKDLSLIIQSAQWAPSSSNGQQVTIIDVKDRKMKEEISKLSGNQPWIIDASIFLVFCLDFHRAKIASSIHKERLPIVESVDALLIGATDVGLSMGNAITAAESLRLGTVPIGGVRNNPDEIIKLLKLPEYVFPICGLAIGNRANNSEQKPRLPKEAVYHSNVYNRSLEEFIHKYDKQMSYYMQNRTSGESDRTWTETISKVYKDVYSPTLKQSLIKQGFKINK